MAKIYYCYSCGEYFSVKNNAKLNNDTAICPHCEGDDTEHAPEEEKDNDDDYTSIIPNDPDDIDEEYDPAEADADPDSF